MKLYAGQVMWEMRLKHRTRCFAKHMAAASLLKKCGCINLCSMPAVGCFSSIYALPRRIAKNLKSNLPFFPGLWIYWIWPLQWCKSGVNQWIRKEHGEASSLFSVRWWWGLLYFQFAAESALSWEYLSAILYYNLLLLFSAPCFARKWILIGSIGGLLESGREGASLVCYAVVWTAFSPVMYRF